MLLIPSKIHAEKLWKAKKYDMNVNVKMSYEGGEADSRDTLYVISKSVVGHDQVFVKKSHVYGILRYSQFRPSQFFLKLYFDLEKKPDRAWRISGNVMDALCGLFGSSF